MLYSTEGFYRLQIADLCHGSLTVLPAEPLGDLLFCARAAATGKSPSLRSPIIVCSEKLSGPRIVPYPLIPRTRFQLVRAFWPELLMLYSPEGFSPLQAADHKFADHGLREPFRPSI